MHVGNQTWVSLEASQHANRSTSTKQQNCNIEQTTITDVEIVVNKRLPGLHILGKGTYFAVNNL